jgi:poly(A) polymerase
VRRDFTVNAIYYDPVGEGRLIDPVGGVGDLKSGTVRMIGDPAQRLGEDPVRLLRALKLVAHYGLNLEPALEQAVRDLAPCIAVSSKARCFEELLKILAKPWTFDTFAVCHDYGLLRYFWPNLEASWTGPEGPLLQHLLELRDRRMSEDGAYLKSKTLGLATVAYPYVSARLTAERGETSANDDEVDVRDVLRSFYEPYTMPRFLQARARDVIVMVPRLFASPPKDYLVRHPQYRYALELARMLAVSQGLDRSLLDLWPPPPEHVRAPRDNRRHGERRPGHRSRHNPQQETDQE